MERKNIVKRCLLLLIGAWIMAYGAAPFLTI